MNRAPPRAVYALIGWPLDHSLSPAMHNAAFVTLGIPATYALRPTSPDDLPAMIDELRFGALAGANVTVPHKVAVRRYLDDESDLVTGIGAVNTIVRTESGLFGHNTDGVGFRTALEAMNMLDGAGKQAVVLGAGGAARAVVHTLLRAGYAVRILARSTSQSGTVAAQLYRAHPGAMLATGLLAPEAVVAEGERSELLVNATPVGAPNDIGLWPLGVPIPAHLTVIDLVAWPLETPLVRHALVCGARAIGGFEMLLGQAARAFTLWTGRAAPCEVMRAAGIAAAAENATSTGLIGGGSWVEEAG